MPQSSDPVPTGDPAERVGQLKIPSETELLGQRFEFRPNWWADRVPAEWTMFVERLPAHERGYRWISRHDLLVVGRNEDPQLVPTAIVAGYIWGTGSSAFLVGRRGRIFKANAVDRIVEASSTARDVLHQEGPEAAYRSLQRGAPNYLKYFGPSFYTKFLYAVDEGRNPERALILDQFVARALNHLEGWDLAPRGPWSAGDYQRWITYAHAAAERERARRDQPVRADAIEMAMFAYGRALAMQPGQMVSYRVGSAALGEPKG